MYRFIVLCACVHFSRLCCMDFFQPLNFKGVVYVKEKCKEIRNWYLVLVRLTETNRLTLSDTVCVQDSTTHRPLPAVLLIFPLIYLTLSLISCSRV